LWRAPVGEAIDTPELAAQGGGGKGGNGSDILDCRF
jgi:hypothetical protein